MTMAIKSPVRLTEKRVVTYNPKLAEKQKYEINRQVEKAKCLRACEAKNPNTGTVQSMYLLLPRIRKVSKRMVRSTWK
jgi:hypothetical protein